MSKQPTTIQDAVSAYKTHQNNLKEEARLQQEKIVLESRKKTEERERIFAEQRAAQDEKNKKRWQSIAHLNIAQTIFDACCNLSDQEIKNTIATTGIANHIVLFQSTYQSIAGSGILGPVKAYQIPSLKDNNIQWFEIHNSFNKFDLNTIQVLQRQDSELNGWTVHVVKQTDYFHEIYKVVLSEKYTPSCTSNNDSWCIIC
jgi:hypothetical protein